MKKQSPKTKRMRSGSNMKNYIKRAVITKAGNDDTARPIQQVEYLGKTSDAEIIFPYGHHANLPENSLLVMFPVLDQSSNQVALGGLPDERIQVDAGEVVFFHPLTKAKIHFKADGNIEIDSLEKDVQITCKSAIIEASASVDITTPTTNINGDLNVSGATALSATVTSNGKDISDTHTHDQPPTPGGSGTYVANTTTGVITGSSGAPT